MEEKKREKEEEIKKLKNEDSRKQKCIKCCKNNRISRSICKRLRN